MWQAVLLNISKSLISNIALHHIYIEKNGDLYLTTLQASANE